MSMMFPEFDEYDVMDDRGRTIHERPIPTCQRCGQTQGEAGVPFRLTTRRCLGDGCYSSGLECDPSSYGAMEGDFCIYWSCDDCEGTFEHGEVCRCV